MVPPRCDNCGRKLKAAGPLCSVCKLAAEQKTAAAVHPKVEQARAAGERAVELAERIGERKLRFLTELLANGGHVQLTCRTVGVSETLMREYAADDPDFALAWETVQDTNVERLEKEADRRALGYQKELTFQGRKTGDTVMEYSDTLLMFRLKALRPEKYRDGPGVQKGSQLSEEELDSALGKMIARRAAKQGAHTIVEVGGEQ